MDIKEFAILASNTLNNKKAQNLLCINIGEKSSLADYFIIATGSSERQLKALCDEVDEVLTKEGLLAKNIEGKASSGWMLMDYGDLIINLFTEEARALYKIEKLWGDCEYLDIE